MSLALYLHARRRGREVELVGVDSNPEVVERVRGDRRGARLRGRALRGRDDPRLRPRAARSRSTCSSACTPATPRPTRRSPPGSRLGAEAIVLAPCCQHECLVQINHALAQRGPGVWRPVVEHGILRARLADLVTDSLRASALEALGYRAEAIEFVAAEHTTKNLMIRAVKRPDRRRAERALREYRELADTWGVKPTARGTRRARSRRRPTAARLAGSRSRRSRPRRSARAR